MEFISRTLFRATLNLPANVPVAATRRVRFCSAMVFSLREANASLEIVKAGLEQSVYNAAHQNSLLYGLFAVFLAIFTGWFGRILFRRD
ncbi:TIGR02186 family protein [Brucella abortus]|nr:TIGR02186 family protein [Brucella abortus]